MTATTDSDTKYKVLVHKASVPLMKGESLGDFTRSLTDASTLYIKQKYNLPSNDGCECYVWANEVYADKAVFSVSNYKAETQKDRYFHVAVKFSRQNDGDFEFTDTLKVRPVTTYVADSSVEKAKVKKALEMDGWTPEGSLFGGVV